ncbi:response regulator [uncultured Flavobacterium sp.]|uniref:response regulator n=1 Tax=uncultured Flavobacterium sp. TaxID=165435 RepID=UPI0025FC3A1B|nr:response regulator [uncultured Flavobacterium sp.]
MKNPKKINIALVDDDSDEKFIFQIALNEINIDYSFQYFSTPQDFLDSLKNSKKNHPDIVFIDMHMPLKNGLELVQEMRKNISFDQIKSVIYSNSVSEVVIQAFKSLGTSDFIIKPPELSEMKAVLKRLIEDFVKV